MSARIVAVTTLLLDVLDKIEDSEEATPSETALGDLLWHMQPDLLRIKRLAVAEMQALAPAVLAADQTYAAGAA